MSDFHGSDANRPDSGSLPPALAAYSEYEVVWELGRGGMGVVYLARNRLMDRYEALKIRSGASQPDEFLREVQATARLTHPNLVTVYSARLVLGTLVLAMEYVDGCDLARLVAERGPLPVAEACELIRQAALGLQHAHDAGVIHRDIKPANLILSQTTAKATVKVLDFGLAHAGDRSGVVSAGTPAFAAPEQFTEPQRVDARSDIYALGGTLYYLLTGEMPFPSQSRIELLRQHREDPPLRVDSVRPDIPVDVADLVERMLAKEPVDRPQSVAEIVRVLARHADASSLASLRHGSGRARADTITGLDYGTPVQGAAQSQGLTAHAKMPVRSAVRRSARVGAGLAAGVLIAALCTGWASRDRAPQASSPEEQAIPPAPRSLFDGRSLDGWLVDGGDAEEWRVEDGAITTTAVRNGPRTWLLSERDFGDFRARFEYRLEPGANSGFVFRAVPGECPVLIGGRPMPNPYHQQIEIADDMDRRWAQLPTGQVNGAGTSTGPALKPHRSAQAPAGEWNRMEVMLRGQKITVRVNDEEILSDDLNRLVAMGSPYPGLHRVRGRIGFQQHARTVAFRNITVEEFAR